MDFSALLSTLSLQIKFVTEYDAAKAMKFIHKIKHYPKLCPSTRSLTKVSVFSHLELLP
jgi:hypothetical protein